MAANPGAQDAKLFVGVFAGLVTNQDPVALPSGASPDCQDMQFLPGGTQSRPCLHKQFATPLGTVTVTYGKTYVDPMGTIRSIFLDSAGNLWVQNITAATVPTIIATTTPGSYARSVTAFGREYIAISDGAHGTEVPLQLSYDAAGNVQLDRVTFDGPGVSPSVSNLILPPVNVAAAGSPLSLTIVEVDPENEQGSGYFASINVYSSSALTGVQVGQTVTISGTSTPFDGTWGPITAIYSGSPNSLIQITAYIPAGTPFWTGSATMTINQGALQRQSNVVTATTSTAHQLQPGYQVQISNAAAQAIGGGVTSIVIDNENTPGLATITTPDAHGLLPGLNVALSGVKPIMVGTSITSITRAGGVATVVMSASTGLSPGAIIQIASVPTPSFNTIAQVVNVTTTTHTNDTFTFAQVDSDATDASGTGSISLAWPIPDTPTPQFFEVVACPSATTFQVSVNYCDGTWTTGAIAYPWDGTFFVQSVPSTTSFTYQQYGPDGTASSVSGSIVATPYGQASPGQHQMQVFFIDREGGITSPSPPVKFVANGGQYLAVTNIPIGPPTCVARGIAFTGAEGAYFFYIPTPPQVNGQLVGTATQINDNTTTQFVFDFADPTLLSATGISITGNNLANQIVLDGALGFAFYGSRLLTWGQRNNIQNFLNLGLGGGYVTPVGGAPTIPTGWTNADTAGTLVNAHYTQGFQITTSAGAGAKGKLSQPAYEDYTGTPVTPANTQLKIRVWLKPSVANANLSFIVSLTSASDSSDNITATISGAAMNTAGSFVEASFSGLTPAVIPSDYTLNVYASSVTTSPTVVWNDLQIIYSANPYLNNMYASYVDNPEGFDGETGEMGPVDDTHAVMDVGILRDNLYMLTLDPGGRLHETAQGITEPTDWVVSEVAANCGTVSAFCLTRSQADDASASGGEELFGWMSADGYRIFGGEEPFKISQEIQRPPGMTFPGAPTDLSAVNMQSARTIWSLNDPTNKVIYLGVPSGSTGTSAAPSRIYMLSYVGLDSAAAIYANPPVHKSLTGKLIATDNGRKWCPWNLAINGAALMSLRNGTIVPVFFAGNGHAPNTGGSNQFGNVYTLDPTYLTDDDYGQVSPYYVSAATPSAEEAQANGLGIGLMLATWVTALIAGNGYMTLSFYCNTLAAQTVNGQQWNPWPLTGRYLMQVNPLRDMPWNCANASAERFFLKFASTPNASGSTPDPTTDNSFSLSRLAIAMRSNKRTPVSAVWP